MFPGTFNMALGVGGAKGFIPSEHFNTVLWAGDNGTNRSITGVGFEPGFVWLKNRTDYVDTGSNHMVFDVVRGATKYLQTDNTDQEETNASSLKSFDADGFTVGNLQRTNSSGKNYVAWCLKAGGAGVSNPIGSITSTVSANTEAGFSVVTYTASGTSNATVGHGLSSTPELVITKGTDTSYNWNVSAPSLYTGALQLNITDSIMTTANRWPIPQASTNLFPSNYVHYNEANKNYVAYCFHSVPGFSKVGSYTGDGSTNNYVELGFRPAFVMVKRTDVDANWIMLDNARDPSNPAIRRLFPNSESNEASIANTVNFNDSGFTAINNFSEINATGGDYIYLAFAA